MSTVHIELLPVGSVIFPKGGNSLIVIIGIGHRATDDGAVYDYAGVPYPIGYINPNSVYLFNNDDIERVFSMGYVNEEQLAFDGQIRQAIEEARQES